MVRVNFGVRFNGISAVEAGGGGGGGGDARRGSKWSRWKKQGGTAYVGAGRDNHVGTMMAHCGIDEAGIE